MAIAAPLVVPVAGALLEAAAYVGSAIAVGLGIAAAGDAADKRFGAQPTSAVQACPKEASGPERPDCQEIVARIQARRQELRQRYGEMLTDDKELYAIRPAPRPPWGSWPGHLQQYRDKQRNLVNLMDQAAAQGCMVPTDPEEWDAPPPPARPLKWEP